MAFETSQINPYANNGGIKNINGFNNVNQINKKPSLLEQITSEDNDKKSEEKERANKSQRRDNISLSESAIERFSKQEIARVEENNSQNNISQEENRLIDRAIEFKGFNEISKLRNLTPAEDNIFNFIRNEVSEILGNNNLSTEDIIAIADEAINNFASEAPNLLENLNNRNITGSQFSRLDRINISLNKANGFGLNNFENQEVSEIREIFSNSLNEIGDRKLRADEISLLTQIQKEISDIEDYKINIRDSIGPNGVVV